MPSSGKTPYIREDYNDNETVTHSVIETEAMVYYLGNKAIAIIRVLSLN